MTAYEMFSKRQKRLSGEQTEVFQYGEIPQPLRVQVVHVWDTALGDYKSGVLNSSGLNFSKVWQHIHDTIARELGVLSLGGGFHNKKSNCVEHILECPTSDALDIVELSLRAMRAADGRIGDAVRQMSNVTQTAEDAISEINHRFMEHGVGYQFVGNEL